MGNTLKCRNGSHCLLLIYCMIISQYSDFPRDFEYEWWDIECCSILPVGDSSASGLVTDFGCSCSHVTVQTLYASCLQCVWLCWVTPPSTPPTPAPHPVPALTEKHFFFLSNLQFCPKQCQLFAKHKPSKRRCKETSNSNRYNKSILHIVVECLFSDSLTSVQLVSE